MAKKAGSNKQSLALTRAKFLKKARKEFVEHGYINASTNRIVEETGMARGSLYYHFKDKRDLFAAVYEQTMEEMLDIIDTVRSEHEDPWDSFLAGCRSFLFMCKEKTVRSILMDANTALSYQERFDILNRTLLGSVNKMLVQLNSQGHFKGLSHEALVILILGMLGEAGRSLDIASDIDRRCDDIANTFCALLERARG